MTRYWDDASSPASRLEAMNQDRADALAQKESIMDERKAVKYHARLVAALRRMICMCRHEDFDEAPCSACVERAALLREIEAEP